MRQKVTKIIISQNVFTSLNDFPSPALIAISNDVIVAVDDIHTLERYRTDDTEVIDVGDRLVIPGLHDAHLHLMFGSMYETRSVNLSTAHSAEEAADLVETFAETRPTDEWIIGYGWDHTNWEKSAFPMKETLDRLNETRPTILFHAEGHYTWVNSRALEIARITSETIAPPFGEIVKDETGEPTGVLIETASNFVTPIALNFPPHEKEALLESFLSLSARYGVTSVNDLYASALDAINDFELYRAFDEANRLTTRIHIYPELDGNIDRANMLRTRYNSPTFQLAGLKQFIDGVVTSHTAYMIEPYVDRPETRGQPTQSPERLAQLVREADREGFQIRLHAIGDGAVRLGLDVFERAAEQNGMNDRRHAIEHIEIIDPDDVKRFKKLNVIPSVQPSHLALMPKESHTLRVAEEKHPYIYPIQTLLKEAGRIAFSTDFPIAPLNPMEQLYYALTRYDHQGNPWNEIERISLAEALKAYTIGAAYSTHRDDQLGTIESGKYADLVIFEKNLFDLSPEDIRETNVAYTIMNGAIVYDANL